MTAARTERQLAPVLPVVAAVGRPSRRALLKRYAVVLVTLDVTAGAAAGLAAEMLRSTVTTTADPPAGMALFAVLTGAAWAAARAGLGSADVRRLRATADDVRLAGRAALLLGAGIGVLSLAFPFSRARQLVFVALPAAAALTVLLRRALARRLRPTGACVRRVVVAGDRRQVLHLLEELDRSRDPTLVVAAACVRAGDEVDGLARYGVPVLGNLDDVADVAAAVDADTVAVMACPELAGPSLRRLAWQLQPMSAALVVAPGLTGVTTPRIRVSAVSALPLLEVAHPTLRGTRRALKAVMDRALAIALLVLGAPLLVVLAVLVRSTSRGPALYRQTRVGLNGRHFTIFKFRTMTDGAHELRAELEHMNERQDGLLFKIREDPRITRVGRFLRRYSLDELPQLLNVAAGDMSLVGPRPPLPSEVAHYGDDVRHRLATKPGLTGLWQVSGRADLSWDDSVRLDLHYVENWSVTLDLIILWRTLSAVVRGVGAY